MMRKLLYSFLFFILLHAAGFGQATQWTGSLSTAWNDNSNWSNGVPVAGSSVTIPNVTNKPVISIAGAVCTSLTISSGIGSNSLTINSSGTLTVSGTIAIVSPTTSGTNVTVINVASGLLSANNITMDDSGSSNRDSSLRIGTGTVTVLNNMTMAGSNNRNDITFTDAGLLYIGGTINGTNGGTINAGTGTVNYNGANQTVGTYNYNNLILSNSGTKTFAVTSVANDFTVTGTATSNTTSNLSVGRNLQIDSGATFSTSGNSTLNVAGTTLVGGALTFSGTGTKTLTGDVTISSGGTWNETVNSVINFTGNFQNNGTYTATSNTSAHNFTGTSKSISGSSSIIIPNVVISVSLTNNNLSAFTISTALSGGGTLTNAFDRTLTIGGSSSIANFNNVGTANINGAGTISTALLNFINTGTLNLGGTGGITGITNNAGGTVNLASSGTIANFNNATATSVLQITAANANNITNLTITAPGNTVNYSGTTQAIRPITYRNLILSNSGPKTFSSTNTVISETLTINSSVVANLSTGSHTAARLNLGGFSASTGTWGSTTSPADNQDNTFFSATTGIVTVGNTNCTMPTQQTLTVANNGATCSSTTGVAIGLSNSQGSNVSYQLYRGSTPLNTVTGTGGAISFGNFNISGTYYVTATSTTFCSVRFTSFVNVTSYSAPVIPIATVNPVACPSDVNGSITINSVAAPAALDFVRNNNQVVDLGSSLLSGRKTFTVEGWIKFNKNDYETRMAIFGQNDAIEIAFEQDNIRCWTPSGGSANLPLTSYPVDNNWHHIAVTGDGTNNGLRIYLDAAATVPVAIGGTDTPSYGTSSSTAKIGYAVMDDTGGGFKGQIFKVGFWSRALTAAEVTALAGGFVEYNASQNGLLAGFNFSEGTGNTIASVGSNAVNATFGTPLAAPVVSTRPTWTDISTYSWASTPAGFTSSSKNITGLTPRTYDLTISLKNCSRTTSFTVGSTNTSPSITTQPSASTICSGANTSFSVAATGTGLSYKWQFSINGGGAFNDVTNGGIYSNATTNTLNITGATAGMDAYQYRVVVSGTCSPTVTSTPVALTVNTPPSITTQPSASTICSGANTTFSVAATGTGLSYQWRVSTDGGTNFNDLSNDAVYSGATASTLNITGAAATMNNYRYRVVINGTCTPATVTSSAVALTVNTAPSITTQPSASTICSGANTSFSVVATGTVLSYKWQFSINGGGAFNDVTNGGIYSNATTNTLNITGATAGMDTYQYRVVVSGTCTPTVTSNAVALTVNTPPSITTQPSASTICSGANTTFSVAATGTGLSYQWRVSTDGGTNFNDLSNDAVYSGATASTLNITGAAATMNNYRYRVVINGTCTPATVTSGAVALTVNTAPSITTQPSASTICSGANTTFSVAATGTVLAYKWQVSINSGGAFSDVSNGGVYSGATTATLSITGATTGLNNNQYRVIVSGTCTPTATSNAVVLTVKSIEATPSKGTVTDVTCLGQGKVVLGNLPLGNFQINQTGTASRSISGSSTTGTYEVTGLAQGTYQFTVQTLTTCESTQLINVVINDQSSTVWTATGWSNGPPTISKSVTISSTVGNPFATDMVACSLTINVPNGPSDPVITVPENISVRITNAVISNAKLVFENGSSLIQTANVSNSGDIVYKRTAKVSRYDLTYWAMPVTADNTFTMKKFSPNTLADKYFTFDASANKWAENLNGTLPMVTGKGYSIRAPQFHDANTKTDFVGVFTGIPNNGNIDIPVDNGKWYLVGNPYPSAVNATTFLDDNQGVGTLYFWAHVNLPILAADGYYYYTDDFIAFNSLGSTNTSTPNYFKGYIAAAQSFFLKSPATTTIKFNNGQRDSNNGQFYKTAQSNIEKNRVWLNFKNTDGVFKQILVGYATGATNTTDVDFDAVSMGSNPLIDFYSINNSKKLSIQGRALPFVKSDVVTLGYMLASKGDYTISIDHADGLFNNGQDIYLEDKTTGKTTNLRLADYTFTTAAGTFNSRFVIRYADKTLGVEDVESLENTVLVSVKNKVVTITSSKESLKEINIFDIGAQLMYNKNNVNSSELQISNLHSSDQALLVKITLENGYTVTKKIIYSNL